ncbi:MAG TPA: hypothetical protein VK638_20900, partial [Edaphobacter sp.]|nr:hypothetical protein [Edaphobacter sp.]
ITAPLLAANRELTLARDEAEDANRAKSEFAAPTNSTSCSNLSAPTPNTLDVPMFLILLTAREGCFCPKKLRLGNPQ